MEFTAESIVHRLINTVAPKFENRTGGYTRDHPPGPARGSVTTPPAPSCNWSVKRRLPARRQASPNARKNRADTRRKFLAKALDGAKKPQEAAAEQKPAEGGAAQ